MVRSCAVVSVCINKNWNNATCVICFISWFRLWSLSLYSYTPKMLIFFNVHFGFKHSDGCYIQCGKHDFILICAVYAYWLVQYGMNLPSKYIYLVFLSVFLFFFFRVCVLMIDCFKWAPLLWNNLQHSWIGLSKKKKRKEINKITQGYLM